MKKSAFIGLAFVYSFASLFLLAWMFLFPLAASDPDFPAWTGWISYPLGILVIATQSAVMEWFDARLD